MPPTRHITDRDADMLEAIIKTLRTTHDVQAYALLKVLEQYRPHASFVKRNLQAFEARIHPDWVVAWRIDGICERLNAILIGCLTARFLGLEFRFLWPPEPGTISGFGGAFAIGNGIPASAAEILAPAFIEKHMVSEDDVLLDPARFHSDSAILDRYALGDFRKVEFKALDARPCWLAPSRATKPFRKNVPLEERAACFRHELFNAQTQSIFAAIDAMDLPEKRIAIHLRGGDVVYGEARLARPWARKKSLTVPMARAVRDHFTAQGYGVFLFGANDDDLAQVAGGDKNVFVPGDLDLPEAASAIAVLRDVWLMAGCEAILSTGFTGVTFLARLVGESDLISAYDLIAPEAEYEASRAWLNTSKSEVSDPLQRAFVAYSCFVVAPEETPMSTLLDHLGEAHRNDPINRQYLLLSMLCAYAASEPQSARTYAERLQDQLDAPLKDCLRRADFRNIHLQMADDAVHRLLRAVQTAEDVPEHILGFVKMALE